MPRAQPSLPPYLPEIRLPEQRYVDCTTTFLAILTKPQQILCVCACRHVWGGRVGVHARMLSPESLKHLASRGPPESNSTEEKDPSCCASRHPQGSLRHQSLTQQKADSHLQQQLQLLHASSPFIFCGCNVKSINQVCHWQRLKLPTHLWGVRGITTQTPASCRSL